MQLSGRPCLKRGKFVICFSESSTKLTDVAESLETVSGILFSRFNFLWDIERVLKTQLLEDDSQL